MIAGLKLILKLTNFKEYIHFAIKIRVPYGAEMTYETFINHI